MKAKAKPRKLPHNIGTHEERMRERRIVQYMRQAAFRVKTGKYIPAVEDKKHGGI